jgi:hypothetical protein
MTQDEPWAQWCSARCRSERLNGAAVSVVKLPPRCSHVRGNHESLGAGYVEEAAPKCRSIEEGFLASRPAQFNAFFGVAVSTRTPTRPERSDKRTNGERPLELPY